MHNSPERERSIEQLLRQTLKATPGEVTSSCLDAETVAAMLDGGLSGPALTATQTHLADCARCQALFAAAARIEPPLAHDTAPHGTSARRRWLTWAVPLTAAAAGVAIWIAVPGRPIVPPAAVTSIELPAPSAPAVEPKQIPQEPPASPVGSQESARQQAQAAQQVPAPPPPPAAEAPRERANEFRREGTASKAEGTTASAAAVDAIRPLAAARTDAPAVDIISPDPVARWRLAGSTVLRSTDGGAQWQTQSTGVTSELTAGSAVSPSVLWVVGRGGVVLLSLDGQTWRRVPFPETADLSAVRARDANSVSVTTSDGRAFSTTNAGATWDPRPLQDF